MKKILRKIADIIPYILLLISFILIIQVATALKKGETPTLFGRAIFLVVTPSMEDTINVGDMIFVNTNETEFHVGDIITFYADIDNNGKDEVVTHRIISVDTSTGVDLYTTRGDNNTLSNNWETDFTDDIIIGKYVGKSGFIGNIYEYLFANGINLIFIVIILVFIIIGAMEVFNIANTIAKAREQKAIEERDKLVEEELERLRKEQEEKE